MKHMRERSRSYISFATVLLVCSQNFVHYMLIQERIGIKERIVFSCCSAIKSDTRKYSFLGSPLVLSSPIFRFFLLTREER